MVSSIPHQRPCNLLLFVPTKLTPSNGHKKLQLPLSNHDNLLRCQSYTSYCPRHQRHHSHDLRTRFAKWNLCSDPRHSFVTNEPDTILQITPWNRLVSVAGDEGKDSEKEDILTKILTGEVSLDFIFKVGGGFPCPSQGDQGGCRQNTSRQRGVRFH